MVALLVISVLLGYGRLLWDRMLFSSDILPHALPQKALIRQYLLDLRWPVLDPYILCGSPLLADVSAGALYPLNLLLAAGSLIDGFHLFVVTHYLAAALTCYALLRRGFRLCPWAAVCGAAGYALGGYAWSMADHMFFQSLPWIPLYVLGLTQAFRASRNGLWSRGYALAVAALVMLLYCGNFQQACDAIVFGGLLAAFAARVALREGHRQQAWRAGLLMGLSAVTALALAAPQLVPTTMAAMRSYRQSGLPLQQAQAWSFPPFRLIEFLIPYAFGAKHGFGMVLAPLYEGSFPWSQSVFLGVPLLVGMVAARPQGRMWPVGWSLAVAAVGLLLAAGKYAPFYRLAYAGVPTFALYRHPEKYLLWMHVGMVLAGSAGLHRILEQPDLKTGTRASLAGAACAGLFALAAVVVAAVWHERIAQALPHWGCLWPLRDLVAWQLGQAGATAGACLTFAFACRCRQRLGTDTLGAVALLLTVAHLTVVHALAPATMSRRQFTETHTAARCLPTEDRHLFRVYADPAVLTARPTAMPDKRPEPKAHAEGMAQTARETTRTPGRLREPGGRTPTLAERALLKYRTLQRNSPALFGLRTMAGFSAIADPDYLQFATFAQHDPTAVCQLTATRYLIVPGTIGADDLPPGHRLVNTASGDAFTILELTTARPRIRVSHRHIIAPASDLTETAMELAGERAHTFANGAAAYPVAVAETPISYDPNAALCHTPNLHVISDEPGLTRLSCTGPIWLVVHDWMRPGWSARTDAGSNLDVVRADGGFMATFLPAGRHTVTFRYRPPGFAAGCAIAAAALAAVATTVYVSRRQRNGPP